jgi:hypothetical protein
MTHHEKLFFVVANGNAASFAYARLEVHREAARVQMSRIEEAIRKARTTGPEPKNGASQDEILEYVRGALRVHAPFSMKCIFILLRGAIVETCSQF